MKLKINYVIVFLLALEILTISFNQYLISSVMHSHAKMAMSGDLMTDAVTIAISEGVPGIYGEGLGVNFDDIQNSINIMKQFDPGYGNKKIQLQGEELKRYIAVTTMISCEFCCGAKAISFNNGQPACGCAHSQAMRGLVAYLIQNYPNQYTNDELLRELSRWKGRYFPKQMINKVVQQISSGQFTPDISSLVIDIDISQYAGDNAPLPSELNNLPDMVGGC